MGTRNNHWNQGAFFQKAQLNEETHGMAFQPLHPPDLRVIREERHPTTMKTHLIVGSIHLQGAIWVDSKIMVPPKQIINLNRVFHYKPFIWGKTPYFWKHPYTMSSILRSWIPKTRCRSITRAGHLRMSGENPQGFEAVLYFLVIKKAGKFTLPKTNIGWWFQPPPYCSFARHLVGKMVIILVGGFNPFEKYARQNGFIFPK